MKLSKREKYSIYAAVGFICLFIVLQLILFPLIDKRSRIQRTLQVKTKILEEMLSLKSEYDIIKKKADLLETRLAGRKKGFSLFSFLDRLAGEAGIKDRIAYMKPSTSTTTNGRYKTSSVEMKLESISVGELVTYLYKTETSKNLVNIKRMSISKTGTEGEFLNAILHVETFEI
jgi:general secretion pathway protein M